MRTLRLRPRGFTIVEMLIAAMIAILIFGIGFAIMNGAMLARAHAAGRIQSTESARIFFDRLRADIDSAFPGPWTAGIEKKDLLKAGTPPLQMGPTIVMTTARTDYSQAQIDAFNTKMDLLGFSTSKVFTDLAVSSVRYCSFKEQPTDDTGVMFREVSLLQQDKLSTIGDPFNYKPLPANEPEWALFPGVSGFEATYWRWNTTTRVLEGPYLITNAADLPQIPSCTHLEVVLTFLDPNKKLPDRVRTFRELLVFPEALK